MTQAAALKTEEYYVKSEPYYEPVGEEIAQRQAVTDDVEMLAAVNELSRSVF